MQIGFWDESLRLEKLSQLGDSLERLNGAIDWEIFRPTITRVYKKEPKGAGGRPPYDYVLMFKILVLQRIYNLSDDQAEYQINDRMSFMRFLGLHLGDRVPDAKKIWEFKDTLAKANVIRELFDVFGQQLKDANLITRTGTIVDATFVEAPRQHNSKEEHDEIKSGNVPEEWKKPEKIHKLRQKDVDATWTRKGNQAYFGYKDHVKADAESKITGYEKGADAYLKKPFEPEVLLSILKGMLENRKRMQAVLSKIALSDAVLEERADVSELKMNSHDRIFVEKLQAMMEEHLSDEEFNVTAMSKEFGMSRTSLFSKMKVLYGVSPQAWITDYRLNKAMELLQSREFNVSEVSYKVGFATLTGFSRSFKNKFGFPPSAV